MHIIIMLFFITTVGTVTFTLHDLFSFLFISRDTLFLKFDCFVLFVLFILLFILSFFI